MGIQNCGSAQRLSGSAVARSAVRCNRGLGGLMFVSQVPVVEEYILKTLKRRG